MKITRQAAASILGVLVSAVLLAFALRNTSAEELAAQLAGTRWWVVAPFLLSLFAYYWIKTIRWATLLRREVAVRPRELFAPVMVGYAAGAVLPMQLGEIVRAWLGGRRLGRRIAPVFMSIALERVFDLISILLIAAVAMLMARSSMWVGTAMGMLGAVAIGGLLVLLALVFRTEQCMRIASVLLKVAPARLAAKILDQIRTSAEGLEALRSGRAIALVFTASLLQWVFMFFCIWLSLYATRIVAPPLAAMLAMIFTVIGTSLPNSPGYVGSIQLAFTLALEPFGIPNSAAIAASLFFHVLAYLSVVIVGLSLLPSMGLGARSLTAQVRTLHSDATATHPE